MSEIRTLVAGTVHRTELEIKRSRFITDLARAPDEGSARALVAAARQEFPDARHHCSAFIVAVPGASPVERSSDDGEPAGTAGMPMLDVLRGSGLVDVIAVVVRYFGGVKLGTGGLVRAYSDAVRGGLETAPAVRVRELGRYTLDAAHGDAGRIEAGLRAAGFVIDDVEYGDCARLSVVAEDGGALAAAVANLTAGALSLRPAGVRRVEVAEESTT